MSQERIFLFLNAVELTILPHEEFTASVCTFSSAESEFLDRLITAASEKRCFVIDNPIAAAEFEFARRQLAMHTGDAAEAIDEWQGTQRNLKLHALQRTGLELSEENVYIFDPVLRFPKEGVYRYGSSQATPELLSPERAKSTLSEGVSNLLEVFPAKGDCVVSCDWACAYSEKAYGSEEEALQATLHAMLESLESHAHPFYVVNEWRVLQID